MPSDGFNVYEREARIRVAADMNSGLPKGEKSTTKNITTEIQRRWAALPECSRNTYNRKAAAK